MDIVFSRSSVHTEQYELYVMTSTGVEYNFHYDSDQRTVSHHLIDPAHI